MNNTQQLLDKFKEYLDQVSKEYENEDFYSLSLGYFGALGLSIKESVDLACHVRYDLEYWNK